MRSKKYWLRSMLEFPAQVTLAHSEFLKTNSDPFTSLRAANS